MSDLHIGIDNGQKGALAALSPMKGLLPISVIPMPMKRVEGVPQMDIEAIVKWIQELHLTGTCDAWIEKCPKHAMSQAAMRSQAINYGKMLGVLGARFPEIRVHRVECGNNLKGWQRIMNVYEKDKTKENALRLARQIWPEYDEWPANGNGDASDGGIDAALIAEFGRRKTQGEPFPCVTELFAAA